MSIGKIKGIDNSLLRDYPCIYQQTANPLMGTVMNGWLGKSTVTTERSQENDQKTLKQGPKFEKV